MNRYLDLQGGPLGLNQLEHRRQLQVLLGDVVADLLGVRLQYLQPREALRHELLDRIHARLRLGVDFHLIPLPKSSTCNPQEIDG